MVHLVDVALLAKEEPLQENETECDSLCGFLRFEASTLSSESSNKGTESSGKTFQSSFVVSELLGNAPLNHPRAPELFTAHGVSGV